MPWFLAAANQPLFGACARSKSVVPIEEASPRARRKRRGALELNSHARGAREPRPAKGILYLAMTRTPGEEEACLASASEERILRHEHGCEGGKTALDREEMTGQRRGREEWGV